MIRNQGGRVSPRAAVRLAVRVRKPQGTDPCAPEAGKCDQRRGQGGAEGQRGDAQGGLHLFADTEMGRMVSLQAKRELCSKRSVNLTSSEPRT